MSPAGLRGWKASRTAVLVTWMRIPARLVMLSGFAPPTHSVRGDGEFEGQRSGPGERRKGEPTKTTRELEGIVDGV